MNPSLLNAAWQVMLELSPWLLLGAIVASLLHVLVPQDFIQRQFHGASGVFKAVALGVPLPLCSCGVIPAGIGLKKDGASSGATVGFLISTPQTGVDSILVSASFLGWPFALFKVFSAFITGIAGGLITNSVGDAPGPTTPQVSTPQHEPHGHTLRSAVEHGVDVIRMIWGWLLVGVVIAALIDTWVPPSFFAELSAHGPVATLLLVLLISIPMYVCATASVPIAAAMVAGGLPPGAALVFLMAGPATNVATIGAVFRGIGKRAGFVYLGTLIVGSLILALIFDEVLALDVALPAHSHESVASWKTGSAVLLSGMMAFFAFEDLKRYLTKLRGQTATATSSLWVDVSGMTCNGCVNRLEKQLLHHDDIEHAEVTLEPGAAKVSGSINERQLVAAIESAGFQPGSPRSI